MFDRFCFPSSADAIWEMIGSASPWTQMSAERFCRVCLGTNEQWGPPRRSGSSGSVCLMNSARFFALEREPVQMVIPTASAKESLCANVV